MKLKRWNWAESGLSEPPSTTPVSMRKADASSFRTLNDGDLRVAPGIFLSIQRLR